MGVWVGRGVKELFVEDSAGDGVRGVVMGRGGFRSGRVGVGRGGVRRIRVFFFVFVGVGIVFRDVRGVG